MGNASSHLPSRDRRKTVASTFPPTASSIGFDAVRGIPVDAASPLPGGVDAHVGALDATSPYADRDMRYEWKVSYGMNVNVLLEQGYTAAAPCTREGHVWMRRPREA